MYCPESLDFGQQQKMATILFYFLLSSLLLITPSTAAPIAYPTVPGTTDTTAVPAGPETDNLVPVRREVHGQGGRVVDITHRYCGPYHRTGLELPCHESEEGIGQLLRLLLDMKNGSDYNLSEMKMSVHSGTHVDAPGHYWDHYFDAGFDVDTLDLDVLNGPGLLVDVPRNSNITAEVMKSLHIPKGVKRVLFRTLNTDRKLMFKKQFDTSYVGFTRDGAQWLVDNTDVKLVGVDYLSVAAWSDLIPAHLAFLENREHILVEGLKLDDVQPGIYSIHCLPLRLLGAEGSPIRCILIKS